MAKKIKYRPIEEFENQVFNEDIFKLLDRLPPKSIDCIFSDPDYNVGIKYNTKSYTIKYEAYIKWYIQLAKKSLRVLKDTGNLFFINYPQQNSYLRVKYLDKACYDVLDYSWVYNSNVGQTSRRFTTAHRSVLHCTKSKDNNFYKDNVAQPYKNPTDRRILENIANGSLGCMPYSWFYFDLVKNVSKEKTMHACQIPQKLSELLIKSCTQENDTVLIHFGGSGAEIDVCRRNRRKFIAAELDTEYFNLINDRITKGFIDVKYKLDMKKETVNELNLFSSYKVSE